MHNTLKKIIVLIYCSLLLIAYCVGCEGKEQSRLNSVKEKLDYTGTEDTGGANKKVTLKLLIDNKQSLAGLKAAAKEIENKYGIKTEFVLRPGGAEGDNVVRTKLAVGDMEDLCAYNSGALFFSLNPAVNFIDLTNEPFMANVVDYFKPFVSSNGKIYGVPFGSFSGGAWLYNRKIYKDLGLEVPKTWKDLMTNCEKIKAAGKVAVIGSYKDSWTAQIIVLSDFYNLNAQVPTFAKDYMENKAKYSVTPEALRGFEKLQEIHMKNYLNQDFLSTNYENASKMLAEGKGAHYPILTSAISTIAENYPDKLNDIGIFAQPGDSADKNGLTVWSCGSIYIYNRSMHIDAAKKWASFLASEEGADTFTKSMIPEGPYAIKNAKIPNTIAPAVKDMLPYFESGRTTPALEYISLVKGPNLPQICVQAGSGIKSALECAQEYDYDVEKQEKQLEHDGIYKQK